MADERFSYLVVGQVRVRNGDYQSSGDDAWQLVSREISARNDEEAQIITSCNHQDLSNKRLFAEIET